MAVIAVATVLGNMAVLVALTRARRAPSHYPLASLATADLLVGLFVLPLGAARELFAFNLDRILCACWSTLDVLCCTASILSLCALGWERWCGITAPLARARRTKRAKMFAALVWPTATAVALPTAFIPSPRHYLPGEVTKACTVNTNVGYVFFSVTLSFYVPACVMVCLYARILRALAALPHIRAHRGRSPVRANVPGNQEQGPTANKNINNDGPQTLKERIQNVFLSPKGCHLGVPSTAAPVSKPSPVKNSSSPGVILSRQHKATRSIVLLMALFLLCWTPFFVMLPLDSLCECVWETAWQWCTWLGYTNSALNPLVYAAAAPSVRRVLHASLSSSTRTTDVPMTPTRRTS